MTLPDASPATLRVVAAALECKARYGLLGVTVVLKIARAEPEADVDQALAILGFGPRPPPSDR